MDLWAVDGLDGRAMAMGYDFSDALRLVKAGERVRRVSWPAAWLFLAEGGPADGPDRVYLIEKRPGEDERATEFVARDAELTANDWEVVAAPATAGVGASDVPPLPTFEDFARGVPSDLKTATELGGALGDPGDAGAPPGGGAKTHSGSEATESGSPPEPGDGAPPGGDAA